jgi:beta-phosphoglucomutase-like phosphatase (HAD superfamily)
VAGVLDFRRIVLDEGHPTDPDYVATLHGLSNRAHTEFRRALEDLGVAAVAGIVALLHRLRSAPVLCAVVSDSLHALEMLRRAHVDGMFELVVDGAVASEFGLRDVHASDPFLWAALQVGAQPDNSLVVATTGHGVAAAQAGGFGAVCIDRAGGETSLAELPPTGTEAVGSGPSGPASPRRLARRPSPRPLGGP